MLDCEKFPQDNDMCITAQSVRAQGGQEGQEQGEQGAGGQV